MLSKPAKRDLKHNRTIEGKGYKREDGLWDIEVFLVDSKTYSFNNMHRGYISAGEPLHDMAVRLTLDDKRKIIDIEAVINASPYNICPQAIENCQKLKGEYVIAGFNRKVLKTLGGEKGCRHISDLLAYAGNIAYQTLWKEKTGGKDGTITLEEAKSIEKKFANSCFALKKDGEVYNQYKEILIGKMKKTN
jgi:hypothetical protein